MHISELLFGNLAPLAAEVDQLLFGNFEGKIIKIDNDGQSHYLNLVEHSFELCIVVLLANVVLSVLILRLYVLLSVLLLVQFVSLLLLPIGVPVSALPLFVPLVCFLG